MKGTARLCWENENREAIWTRNVRSYLERWRDVVRSIELERGGKRYRAVSHRGGPLELYAIGPDGLETFVGYAVQLLGTVDDRAQNMGASLVINC